MGTTNKLTLNRKDIKLLVTPAHYYYDGRNITCEVCYRVKMPTLLFQLIGPVNGCLKATAYCDEEDTYCKSVGERIALAKAESNAYAAANAKIAKRLTLLENMIYMVEPLVSDFNDKTDTCIDHNTTYISAVSSAEHVKEVLEEEEKGKAESDKKNKKGFLSKFRKNGSTDKEA